MTLGEKIKNARKQKNITQNELVGDRITRSMLSSIERNKAMPSIETLTYIADKLSVHISYFFSDGEDLFLFLKKDSIDSIRKAYSEKKYKTVIGLIDKIGQIDDELAHLLAGSYFELGKQAVLSGALISAKDYLAESKKYCDKTVLDTSRFEMLITLYSALATNIQSPMLEFDAEYFDKMLRSSFDLELYHYIINDSNYEHKSSIYLKHKAARELIKNRNYLEAIKALNEIISERNSETYNAHLMFLVYTDMEFCSKQLMDFESAYKYASKKLSMIEGFKA